MAQDVTFVPKIATGGCSIKFVPVGTWALNTHATFTGSWNALALSELVIDLSSYSYFFLENPIYSEGPVTFIGNYTETVPEAGYTPAGGVAGSLANSDSPLAGTVKLCYNRLARTSSAERVVTVRNMHGTSFSFFFKFCTPPVSTPSAPLAPYVPASPPPTSTPAPLVAASRIQLNIFGGRLSGTSMQFELDNRTSALVNILNATLTGVTLLRTVDSALPSALDPRIVAGVKSLDLLATSSTLEFGFSTPAAAAVIHGAHSTTIELQNSVLNFSSSSAPFFQPTASILGNGYSVFGFYDTFNDSESNLEPVNTPQIALKLRGSSSFYSADSSRAKPMFDASMAQLPNIWRLYSNGSNFISNIDLSNARIEAFGDLFLADSSSYKSPPSSAITTSVICNTECNFSGRRLSFNNTQIAVGATPYSTLHVSLPSIRIGGTPGASGYVNMSGNVNIVAWRQIGDIRQFEKCSLALNSNTSFEISSQTTLTSQCELFVSTALEQNSKGGIEHYLPIINITSPSSELPGLVSLFYGPKSQVRAKIVLSYPTHMTLRTMDLTTPSYIDFSVPLLGNRFGSDYQFEGRPAEMIFQQPNGFLPPAHFILFRTRSLDRHYYDTFEMDTYEGILSPYQYNVTMVAERDGLTSTVYAVTEYFPDPIVPDFGGPYAPSVCPPPPPGFYCTSDGSWVSPTSVETGPTFIVRTGHVVVAINMTSNSSIVFDGSTANSFNLTIGSCLVLAPGKGIVLDLSSGSNKGGQKKLHIETSESCSGSLLMIPISIKQPTGCEKYSFTVEKGSTKHSLDVIFVLERSGCKKSNTTWVIVVATLGAVLVLLVVVVAITYVIVKKRSFNKSEKALEASIQKRAQ